MEIDEVELHGKICHQLADGFGIREIHCTGEVGDRWSAVKNDNLYAVSQLNPSGDNYGTPGGSGQMTHRNERLKTNCSTVLQLMHQTILCWLQSFGGYCIQMGKGWTTVNQCLVWKWSTPSAFWQYFRLSSASYFTNIHNSRPESHLLGSRTWFEIILYSRWD